MQKEKTIIAVQHTGEHIISLNGKESMEYLIEYEYCLGNGLDLPCRKKSCPEPVRSTFPVKWVMRIISVRLNGTIQFNHTANLKTYQHILALLMNALTKEYIQSFDDLLCYTHRKEALNGHPLGAHLAAR